MKKGPETTTISVRLRKEQAEVIRARATAAGFKNVNQYLMAVLDILAPLVPAQKINNSGATESWPANQNAVAVTEKSAVPILSEAVKA